jgi:putative lipoic acid-binding regulatory protein
MSIYPCDLPIKVIGLKSPDLLKIVTDIVKHHVTDIDLTNIEQRSSHREKYLSITITLAIDSRSQLQTIYQDLKAHPMIKFVL